tara:strand:- start:237 stop:1661 length:1425 start_codon:yes stop_codon:yes gene_type:complete
MIKLDEIEDLELPQIKKFYSDHVSIGIPKILGMLGFDKEAPESAEGMYIYTKSGRKIYDFTGGISVLNLGHNHPRILKCRREFNKNKRMEVWKLFLSPYLGVLSKNLSEISPGDLNYPFFCNSGAEANEGAIKIATKYQGSNKDKIVYTDISYHGKTHATLSVSGIEESKKYFKQLDGCIQISYGDWQSFENVIKEQCQNDTSQNDIIAIILEAVSAGTIMVPPKGYLKNIRRLCDENDILLIIDDIFCGFGRTGKMFSFEHENVIPDIFTVSKSLGGGKGSIAAYIAREHIYKKAYGDIKNYMMHSTTFNGLGEECYTAIEAINVIIEEHLVYNSNIMGEYLRSELNKLKSKYPKIIKNVRGIGLMNGIELKNPSEKIISALGAGISFFKDMGQGILPGIVLSQLFHQYNILASGGSHARNLISINPSLIVTKKDIDYLIQSLDDYFSKGFVGMYSSYGKMRFSSGVKSIYSG